jgi:SAM-dependent methyltransferase
MTDAASAWSKSFATSGIDALRSYDEVLVPAAFGPCADLLVDTLEIGPRDRALDVACGTGVVTRALARSIGDQGSVVGTDISPGMIALAQGKDAEPGAAPIEYLTCPAAPLDVADAAFDILTCQHGLQFVPDLEAACRELLRAAAPGARLGVLTWAPLTENPLFAALQAAINDTLGAEAASTFAGPWSMAPERVAEAVTAAGFQDVKHARHTLSVTLPLGAIDAGEIYRFSAVWKPLTELDEQGRQSVFDALSGHLDDLCATDGSIVTFGTADLVQARAAT